MAQIAEADLASAFLKELHAPDTPLMRKAVVAWMRHESGHNIIGNNPWNIRPTAVVGTPICGSRTSVSSGQFAVFCTPQDGAKAAARLLVSGGDDWRGYGRVVRAAKSGNPLKFLDALARSAWSGSRYGGPNNNGLLKTYASMSGLSYDTLQAAITGSKDYDSNPTGGGSGTPIGPNPDRIDALAKGALNGTASGGMLGAWADAVSFPVGHVLTAADVQLIMATLAAHGYFNNDVAGVGQSITATILLSKVGQPWNEDLLRGIQKALFTSANEAMPKTPLDPLFAVAGSVAQVVGALFDPYKWLLVLALLAGTVLTGWGGINIARAAA